ncbi:tail fiber assembly protein [Escherichia coli]|uniref:tail fiber assembly protein n=1 Tax=Escherichia coli TaxID=562 RepID=UPI001FF0F448|nr:tail fiber assembly protein [Escherichia coli]MCJ8695517.1 tail fiber assembly protein [Escherichia coli]
MTTTNSSFIWDETNVLLLAYVLKDRYEAAGMWPENGIDVSDEVSAEFTGQPPDGKTLGVGSDGMPAWVDLPPPSHEELVAQAEAEKQGRIGQANDYMNSKQWPGKAAMGRLSNTEKTQYNAWLDYLDELEAIDTSTAPNIMWPTSPDQN